MLTIRQNFMETITGGNPDRFVKQYEFMAMIPGGNPVTLASKRPAYEGAPNEVNSWGVRTHGQRASPGVFRFMMMNML